MTLIKRTSYPTTISCTPAQVRAMQRGKIKRVKIYDIANGNLLADIRNVTNLLKKVRSILNKDMQTVKYFVLRFR